MRTITATAMLAVCVLMGPPAGLAETRLSPENRSGLDITLYGNGLALITDQRPVSVAAGVNHFVFDGVTRRMVPSSALISTNLDIQVLAMTYDTDLLTRQALLTRAVGTEVGVVRTHPETGEETLEGAELLSVEGGDVILRYRDRIETEVPGRLVFPDVPADLRAEPALSATVRAPAAADGHLTLSYLSEGMSWQADYAIVLDDDASTLDLAGRATLANATGLDFESARVGLIAGEVQRLSPGGGQPLPGAMAADAGRVAMAPAPAPERVAFGDLHLYRIGGTVDLRNRESRQVALNGAQGVPFERRYVSEAGAAVFAGTGGAPRPGHPLVELRFDNAAGGEPWPEGIARIYTRDSGGALRLLGEDTLPRTPAGETVELTPGRAFDITVRRTQTDFARSGLKEGIFESAHRTEVFNAKAQPVSVRVVEILPGEWIILDESAPHTKEAANRAEWTVEVPAGGRTTFTYRVRVQR